MWGFFRWRTFKEAQEFLAQGFLFQVFLGVFLTLSSSGFLWFFDDTLYIHYIYVCVRKFFKNNSIKIFLFQK